MSLKRKQIGLWLSIVAVLGFVLILGFVTFDIYVNRVAHEIINTVLDSEAAAIQQGNLLNSITKLQSSVDTSESLRGVAVYDTKLDPKLTYPLIVLGYVPQIRWSSKVDSVFRLGIFDKVFVKNIPAHKVILFYFEPKFVLWSYGFFSLVSMVCAFSIVWLGRQLESVRAKERADVFFSISQQISHDIKSPIGALKIFGEVLKRKGQPSEMLLHATHRIEEIVADLKSRADSIQQLYVSAEEFSVHDAIRQVLEEKRVEHNAVVIESEIRARLFFKGSAGQFKRVLSNLINNAAEASHDGAHIKVAFNQVRQAYHVEVIDQGQGIAKEHLERIFLKGVSVGKRNGSGLGLYHAQNVIEGMGGKIEIKSEIGKGTTVSILFNG